MSRKRKYTQEYIEKSIKTLGYILISINNNGLLILTDNEGYYYISSANRLFNNNLPRKFYPSNPYTIQNIKLWCKLNNKPFELIDKQEYECNDKKLKWKCLKEGCGEIFDGVWNDIQRDKANCTYCSISQYNKINDSNRLSIKNPILSSEWHPTKNGYLTSYDVSVSSGESVWWQCLVNPEHEWYTSINSRNQHNYKCPFCSGYYPSKDNNLLVCYPDLCKEWNYEKNDKTPDKYTSHSRFEVWWKCRDCGHEWKATPRNRNGKYKTGCPECNKSKGEKKIKEVCKLYNIPHDSQHTFDNLRGVSNGLLKFDVPVFWDKQKTQLRMLIEFDGEQHFRWIKGMMIKENYENLRIHDKLKNEYCKNNNIKLLRIKYDQFDNIEEILIKELNLTENKLKAI